MKKLCAFTTLLWLSCQVFSQTNSTNSTLLLQPGTDSIVVAPADHWRLVLPEVTVARAAFHLTMAAGCWQQLTTAEAQITQLRLANAATTKADTLQQYATDALERAHTIDLKAQRIAKRREKWRRFGDKLTVGALGAVAVAEAAYILWLEAKR